MKRRTFLMTSALGLVAVAASAHERNRDSLQVLCHSLEQKSGGRLGVYMLDGRDGQEFVYHGDERFPLCSSFKWLAAAALLDRVDQGRESLERRIRFSRGDLLEYSPATKAFVGGPGMTLAQISEAAIADSDNTAGNLLLSQLGGPSGFNEFLRAHADQLTRLDRIEPDLNEGRAGDLRDTTTPRAMGLDLRRLLIGDALSPAARRQLTDWMLATRTSGERLRAGLNPGWLLADKTGSGGYGSACDVGVYWTPDRKAIVLCVYLTEASLSRAEQSALIADIGRRVRD